ncbi:MAG TPA: hypothetical protein VI750_07785 [Pyrinomonadaceae bacterium]|nr:hypothetical protein [Pyrinomonadaceae bacterium]
MTTAVVRAKLGEPMQQADDQDFFMIAAVGYRKPKRRICAGGYRHYSEEMK